MNFVRFLRGESLPEFEHIVRHRAPNEHRNDPTCFTQILRLYNRLARTNNGLSFTKLKLVFRCGAVLIALVKTAITQERQNLIVRRGRRGLRNDVRLRKLIDWTALENRHVSDTELSSVLGVSQNTVNGFRHDHSPRLKHLRRLTDIWPTDKWPGRSTGLPFLPQNFLNTSIPHSLLWNISIFRPPSSRFYFQIFT